MLGGPAASAYAEASGYAGASKAGWSACGVAAGSGGGSASGGSIGRSIQSGVRALR
jgi:hypothetical protein